jgi:hypothetical protein
MYLSTLPQGKKKLRGVWFEADQKIQRYIALAKALQNADGSFSTEHFRGPGYSDDFAARITTSGHQLEWLMIALPQSKLKEEWFRRAIANVARDLINNRHVASDCGPLYHGMHALVVYRQRTVPGYLIPQFNSEIKLSDRGKKKPDSEETATRSKPSTILANPVKAARPANDKAAAAESDKAPTETIEKPAPASPEDVTAEPTGDTPAASAQPQPARVEANVSTKVESDTIKK